MKIKPKQKNRNPATKWQKITISLVDDIFTPSKIFFYRSENFKFFNSSSLHPLLSSSPLIKKYLNVLREINLPVPLGNSNGLFKEDTPKIRCLKLISLPRKFMGLKAKVCFTRDMGLGFG